MAFRWHAIGSFKSEASFFKLGAPQNYIEGKEGKLQNNHGPMEERRD